VKRTVAMTIYDRTPETIGAVFAGLSLPGNRPDVICVCYDRAPDESVKALRTCALDLKVELQEEFLTDGFKGPRCPSRSWNAALALTSGSHVFCMSSDVVLAPHSVGMAYHLAEVAPKHMIVGRMEHCGQSYAWSGPDPRNEMKCRTITWSGAPSGLGFAWLLPMENYRNIGGFDEAYMDGYCYEDDDFVLRMWDDGADFLFCDDIMGFHLEHKRDHLKDQDGKVSINADIFKERHGDLNRLKHYKFEHAFLRFDVGMSAMLHEEDAELIQQCFIRQKFYGQEESWRAIPVVVLSETKTGTQEYDATGIPGDIK